MVTNIGRVGVVFKETYSAIVEYTINDIVSFGVSQYISLQSSNTGNTPPTNGVNTSFWAYFVNGDSLSNGYKNIIINGDFRVNQRGAATITDTTQDPGGEYTYDRWIYTGGTIKQRVEDGNYEPNSVYTLSGDNITTIQLTSPASGTWTVDTGVSNPDNVQLEKGTVVTSFEKRPIGLELFLCERYYWKRWVQFDVTTNTIPTSSTYGYVKHPARPRTVAGTFTVYSIQNGSLTDITSPNACREFIAGNSRNVDGFTIGNYSGSDLITNQLQIFANVSFDSEL